MESVKKFVVIEVHRTTERFDDQAEAWRKVEDMSRMFPGRIFGVAELVELGTLKNIDTREGQPDPVPSEPRQMEME